MFLLLQKCECELTYPAQKSRGLEQNQHGKDHEF